jgi:protocatechuate 3,4-dioxygenase beta subunit
MLGLVGAAGAAALAGAGEAAAQRLYSLPPIGSGLPACIVTPSQMEGPYFSDVKLNRADIRVDPTTNAVSDGLPLRLRMHVSRVDGNSCAPVTGAQVDVWQCDALGVYSDFRDANGFFDTAGKKFLRGYQITDKDGFVEFVTVYPGWYRGRAVHIHFKVRVNSGAQRAYEFTSQLYFDESITDQVHAQAPYAGKGRRDTTNERDGIFRRENGPLLMLDLARQAQGYLGTFAVGLRMT